MGRGKPINLGLSRRKILALLGVVAATVILTACAKSTTSSPATSSVAVSPKTSTTSVAVPASTTSSAVIPTSTPPTTSAAAAAKPPPPGGGPGGAPPPSDAGAGAKPPPPGGGQGGAQPPPGGGPGGVYPGVFPKPPGGMPANKTVGLLYKDAKAFNGYTLFAPAFSTITYLIDMDGKLVHTWDSTYSPGQSVYLVDDGILVRSTHISNLQGPAGGGVQKIAWDGTMLWDFKYLTDTVVPHHDIRPMPNGNVLLICWDMKTRDEAIAAGRNPASISEGRIWSEKIVEIKPDGKTGGTVVWEWKLWDHLIQKLDSTKTNFGVVSEHPELMDINFALGGKADWIHANAIDYNAKLDQIMISCHEQSELWVIDHSTTTAEAATHKGGKVGKGGDLIYRWGNPAGYGAGTAANQKLFAPHNTRWIEAGLPGEGNILVFNNGNNRPGGNYSSSDEIVPPVDAQGRYALTPGTAYGPTEQTWIYKAKTPTEFFADKTSSSQRLPNGNTLVCHGPLGTFWEVTKDGDIVWEYLSPVAGKSIIAQGAKMPSDPGGGNQNGTFRAIRFAANDPALKGKDLTAGKLIEDNPSAVAPSTGQGPPPPAQAPPAAGGGPAPAAASGSTAPNPAPKSSGTMKLTSSAVKEGGDIPDKYSRQGAKNGITTVSPPLAWTGAPAGTQSFAVIGWNGVIFWSLWNIPGTAASLPEDVKGVGVEGQKFQTPSEGGPGTYAKHITLYALSANVNVPAGADVETLRKALNAVTLDSAVLNYNMTVQ